MPVLIGSRFAAALVTLGASLLLAPVGYAGHGLTRAQFDSRAKQICNTAKRQDQALGLAGSTAASMAERMRAGAKIESREVHALTKLSPPTTLSRPVARGLRQKRHWIAATRSIARQLSSGTLSVQQAAQQWLKVPIGVTTWTEIGAPACQF
jgi:hypothetical protein